MANTSNKVGDPAAIWVEVSKLRPWDKNPRKNDGTPVKKVMQSITKFGFAAPIVARTNGEIIAGHTRWKAAIELGLKTVPVRYLDLSDADAHTLAIADNRLNEEAEWDNTKLTQIINELMLQPDVVITDTGMDQGDLNRLLAEKGVNDYQAEWVGMPECENEDISGWGSVKINFAKREDMEAFSKLVGQPLTEKTKSIWFPKAEIVSVTDKAYEAVDA